MLNVGSAVITDSVRFGSAENPDFATPDAVEVAFHPPAAKPVKLAPVPDDTTTARLFDVLWV